MISIQELGIQILQHNPKKFYVFGGSEYGIKMRYIDELEKYYGHKEEYDSVSDLLDFMNVKHLIPLKPTVYVIRYDDTFYNQLSERYAAKIERTNILGTVVCLYDNLKIITKMDKFIPQYTAIIDKVNPQFIAKYLKKDFPDIPDNLINIVVSCSSDYGQAKNMCYSMMLDLPDFQNMTGTDIKSLFGHQDLSTQTQLRQGIAARNFQYLISIVDMYDGSLDTIFYTILQTMIDLDKLMENRYMQSDMKEYVKSWSREDIYYMFMHTYEELKKSRSTSYDILNGIIYLFGLLKFTSIPSVEEMKS